MGVLLQGYIGGRTWPITWCLLVPSFPQISMPSKESIFSDNSSSQTKGHIIGQKAPLLRPCLKRVSHHLQQGRCSHCAWSRPSTESREAGEERMIHPLWVKCQEEWVGSCSLNEGFVNVYSNLLLSYTWPLWVGTPTDLLPSYWQHCWRDVSLHTLILFFFKRKPWQSTFHAPK